MIFVVLFLFSALCHADWLATVDYAGFFGTYSLGGIYELNPHHSFHFSGGIYTGGTSSPYQFNIGYRYSPFRKDFPGDYIWVPVSFGTFLIVGTDQNAYFSDSPGKYPSHGYYDQTAYRLGAEVGSLVTWGERRWEFAYYLRVIDLGFTALYNNSDRDLQYFISSGVSLHYRF